MKDNNPPIDPVTELKLQIILDETKNVLEAISKPGNDDRYIIVGRIEFKDGTKQFSYLCQNPGAPGSRIMVDSCTVTPEFEHVYVFKSEEDAVKFLQSTLAIATDADVKTCAFIVVTMAYDLRLRLSNLSKMQSELE